MKIKVRAGCNIYEVLRLACEKAFLKQTNVEFVFNEQHFEITPADARQQLPSILEDEIKSDKETIKELKQVYASIPKYIPKIKEVIKGNDALLKKILATPAPKEKIKNESVDSFFERCNSSR